MIHTRLANVYVQVLVLKWGYTSFGWGLPDFSFNSGWKFMLDWSILVLKCTFYVQFS